MHDRNGRVLFCRRPHDLIQEVSDHGMADGRDADGLSLTHEIDDDPRAEVRLAGPRRPLDREHATVKRAGAPLGGRDDRLASRGERLVRSPPWGEPQQEVPGAARYGPAASIPCSCTHSPNRYSASANSRELTLLKT